MKKLLLISALSFTALPAMSAPVSFMDYAHVVDVHPVYADNNVPTQVCTPGSQGTAAGNVLGGVAGGLLGHQFGHGRGKTATTILGAIGGSMVGGQVESNMNQPRCYTQYQNQEVPMNDVTLQYGRHRFHVMTPRDPGQWMRVRVNVTVG